MAAEELHRHDGGPLERSHMKDMIQRNALESAAYDKVARHLETQKKAFVRQNTRDEGEMKNLLYRLQMEQQTAFNDSDSATGGDIGSDTDDVDGVRIMTSASRLDRECVANPYPVTIIPKFGTSLHTKQSLSARDTLHRPESSRLKSRRKSVEYEDIQESLSTMSISNLPSASLISEQMISSSSTCLSHDDHASRDWLATPVAISSVRRMRKSVTEQAHQRILRKTSCEHLDSCPLYSSSPPSHSRNNSLKEKKKFISSETTSAERGYGNKRGGSLKERKTSAADKTERSCIQPKSRSYSVLTTAAFSELNKKQKSVSSGSGGINNDGGLKPKRKNSKKSEKQGLSRKSSNDSTSSADGGSPSHKKTSAVRKIGVTESPESSPVISPLARDVDTFKF